MSSIVKPILIMLCVFVPFVTHAVSFTADAVQFRGAEISHARMFWNDGNVRFEYMDHQGVPMVQIFDNEKRRVIWLDTEKKVFVERELTDQQASAVPAKLADNYDPCDEFPGAECNYLKSAEWNGRQVDKWLITQTVRDRDRHIFQWVDQKHQVPVRQENPDGSVLDVTILDDQEINGRKVRKLDMVATAADGSRIRGIQWFDAELNVVVRQRADNGAIDELRNIRIEEISPELFAIPDGYTTVESQLSDLDAESAVGFGITDN